MAALSVFMDLVMAGLLLATLIYCLKLNKRIKLLQDSRSELAQIIREFDESTQRATQNINEIHEATRRISDNIQHKIDKASFLADDLEIMIDKANKAVGKVEIATPRAPRMNPEPSPAAPTTPTAPTTSAGSSIRRTLADILPSRSREAGQAATDGTRPQRARSRAEQDLMNLMGNKSEGSR